MHTRTHVHTHSHRGTRTHTQLIYNQLKLTINMDLLKRKTAGRSGKTIQVERPKDGKVTGTNIFLLFCAWSPFLTGQTVSLPNVLWTVWCTTLHLLIELRWNFSSPNMVRTVRLTILYFLTGLQCNASFGPNVRKKCSRQHDPKCRLKLSQYILLIPHRASQLTTISFWVPETRMCIPQVNK